MLAAEASTMSPESVPTDDGDIWTSEEEHDNFFAYANGNVEDTQKVIPISTSYIPTLGHFVFGPTETNSFFVACGPFIMILFRFFVNLGGLGGEPSSGLPA